MIGKQPYVLPVLMSLPSAVAIENPSAAIQATVAPAIILLSAKVYFAT